MSTVSSVQNTPTTTQQTGALTGKSALGKEEFLTLLVSQLKNQDPMNPMDGQQFAAQLAQFSTVEQLINIEKAVAAQSENQSLLAQSMNSGLAAGMIGKDITAVSDMIPYSGSGRVPLQYELEGATASAIVTIYDASGNQVREIKVDAQAAGTHRDLEWDGTSTSGAAMPEGTYYYAVKALDAAGDEVASMPLINGNIDRITFGPDGALLWIGKHSVPLSNVRSIEQD